MTAKKTATNLKGKKFGNITVTSDFFINNAVPAKKQTSLCEELVLMRQIGLLTQKLRSKDMDNVGLNDRSKKRVTDIRKLLKQESITRVEFQFELPRSLGQPPIKDTVNLNNKTEGFIQVIKSMKEQSYKKVRELRAKQKENRVFADQFFFTIDKGRPSESRIAVSLNAGCHKEPGEIVKLAGLKKQKSVFDEKKPKTKENHVGVEIEFLSKLKNKELGLKLMMEGMGDYVTVKSDGSLRNEEPTQYHPCEVTICVPESKAEKVLEVVCEILNKNGCVVNKTCGLHVHLDMRNRDRNTSFSNLVASNAIMYAMQPKKRRENEYCISNNSRDMEATLSGRDPDTRRSRYLGVNPLAFERHQTIEVRIHTGTTNATKIKNWVAMLILIADRKVAVRSNITTVEELKSKFELNDTLAAYVQKRIDKFKPGKQIDAEKEYSGEVAA